MHSSEKNAKSPDLHECFEVECHHSTFGFANLFDIGNFSILEKGAWNNLLLCLQTF